MASVAKWLRQWFVVPPFVGSSPIVRPKYVKKAEGSSLKAEVSEEYKSKNSFSLLPTPYSLLPTPYSLLRK